MDRRTFLRGAAAVGGGVSLSGCSGPLFLPSNPDWYLQTNNWWNADGLSVRAVNFEKRITWASCDFLVSVPEDVDEVWWMAGAEVVKRDKTDTVSTSRMNGVSDEQFTVAVVRNHKITGWFVVQFTSHHTARNSVKYQFPGAGLQVTPKTELPPEVRWVNWAGIPTNRGPKLRVGPAFETGNDVAQSVSLLNPDGVRRGHEELGYLFRSPYVAAKNPRPGTWTLVLDYIEENITIPLEVEIDDGVL